MQKTLEKLHSVTGQLKFGNILLTDGEKEFCQSLSTVILETIESSPLSIQTELLIQLVGHLKIPLGKDLNFFKGFYPPTWSILYWIYMSHGGNKHLGEEDTTNIGTIHATAMLLHLLDDHLHDGELPATHAMLLLRSQLWLSFKKAIGGFCTERSSYDVIAENYINEYYTSFFKGGDVHTLEAYCQNFKKQMGLGFIAPVFMTKRLIDSRRMINAIETIFSAFGLAWRLLDDLQDIWMDMNAGFHSSVYYCLSDRAKGYWDTTYEKKEGPAARTEGIIQAIMADKIPAQIVRRINGELKNASQLARKSSLEGYAKELLILGKPLRNVTI